MQYKSIFRAIPAVLALAAASFSLNVSAQGEPFPKGEVNTSANPAPTPEVVKKVQNSRAGKATKRGMKKVGTATSNAGKKTAGAIRNTGNKISSKLPEGTTPGPGPGPAPAKN